MLFYAHVLPYIRSKLVLLLGGDEVHLSDLPQLMVAKLAVCEAAFVNTYRQHLMHNVICWDKADYSDPESSEDVTEVTGRLQQVTL